MRQGCDVHASAALFYGLSYCDGCLGVLYRRCVDDCNLFGLAVRRECQGSLGAYDRGMGMRFVVNGVTREVADTPERPLLWVLRDEVGLLGTRFGCGQGQCGACTVLLDGEAVRSCQTPVRVVEGRAVTTIEGLAEGGRLHPVQQAFLDEQVPQCGYCMSGQVMSAVGLLLREPHPTDEQIVAAMRGNLCRCGTYVRIKRAIRRAVDGKVGV